MTSGSCACGARRPVGLRQINESRAELEIVHGLGADFAQGYFLALPAARPASLMSAARSCLDGPLAGYRDASLASPPATAVTRR